MPPLINNKSKSKKANSSRLWSMFFPVLFALFALLLAFMFGYIPATQVVGSEFNTATWMLRDFQYRREPFTKIQLTGIVRDKNSAISSTAKFPSMYFNGNLASSKRWDLVEIRNGASITEGPAKILVTFLRATAGGNEFWPDWSTKNKVKATILWPAVRDLVDLQLYSDLPSIIEQALVDCSDQEFQTSISESTLAAIDKHCRKLQIEGLTEQLQFAEKIRATYRSSTALDGR